MIGFSLSPSLSLSQQPGLASAPASCRAADIALWYEGAAEEAKEAAAQKVMADRSCCWKRREGAVGSTAHGTGQKGKKNESDLAKRRRLTFHIPIK